MDPVYLMWYHLIHLQFMNLLVLYDVNNIISVVYRTKLAGKSQLAYLIHIYLNFMMLWP